MIEKYSLSDYEKYIYLLRQLSGNAKALIETMSVSDLSYSIARELLDKAFCSKIDQQYAVIARLSKLKMGQQDDPYRWICESRSLKDQVDRLAIDSNLFVQYFLWEGLNESFRAQYVGITNTSKPSLDQILEHSFEANNRYKEFGMKSVRPKIYETIENTNFNETVTLAAQIKDPMETKKGGTLKGGCLLCLADSSPHAANHRMYQCLVYPNAAMKCSKLKSLNACLKCGFTNHGTKDCKYNFSRTCIICDKLHFSYLCMHVSKDNVIKSQNNVSKVSTLDVKINRNKTKGTINQLVQLAIENKEFDKVLLPTFSLEIENKSKGKLELTCLLDTASQASFLLEEIVNKLNLKIVEDLEITIDGFNEKKTYLTKLVELDLIVDGHCRTIRAISIPKIRTSIVIPEVANVVHKFREMGYELADKKLNGKIYNNIELLIGMDNGSIFPIETVLYGTETEKSMYLKSSLGIILLGSVTKMIKNMKNVPECDAHKQ